MQVEEALKPTQIDDDLRFTKHLEIFIEFILLRH
ncbi:hypothetical protein WN51_02771 [Melipona quadrifasciata]|uniref:Uncharacterized protein n=1 Tax=Melipona quadrifasciata TaxID=166423 RepID=A0A0M9A8N6_9HYME|nr:hypothetical protein WN51_02771 [Melipona quadrifasciata]